MGTKTQKDKLFNEMRETRTGFGAKAAQKGAPAGGFKAEGGLQPDDDDDDDEDLGDDDEDEEGDEGEGGVDEDEEEAGSDHDF